MNCNADLFMTGWDFSACSAKLINPAWVELRSSRGYESASHKLFMRATGKHGCSCAFYAL